MESVHGPIVGLEAEYKSFSYLDLVGLRNLKTREDYRRILREFFEVNGFETEEVAIKRLKEGGADDAVLRFIAALRRPRPGKPRGLSAKSIHLYVGVIRGWLEFNEIPFNRVKIRKALPKKKAEKEAKAFDKATVRTIINLMHPSKKLACWTMFACGLRISEMVNLKVRDLRLDLDPPRLYIRESKTPAGRRVVFIPGDLAEKLREWVKDKRPEWPVFPSTIDPSKPMHHNRFRIAFYGVLKRLGPLKRDPSGRGYIHHPHSLRRSFETILKNAGMNRDVLAKLMGHELGVDESYYKPTEEELAREWIKFERYLRLDSEESVRMMEERDKMIKKLERQVLELQSMMARTTQLKEILECLLSGRKLSREQRKLLEKIMKEREESRI